MRPDFPFLKTWQLAAGLLVGLGFASLAWQSPAAGKGGDDDEVMTRKNLKIIPRKITAENLEIYMTRMSREIGEACTYCHVNTKNVFPERADFASDANPMKEKTRQMMRMTDRINKTYFSKNFYDVYHPPKVTCRTCHRGLVKPSRYKIY